jgi:hypothetical protein
MSVSLRVQPAQLSLGMKVWYEYDWNDTLSRAQTTSKLTLVAYVSSNQHLMEK